MPKKIASSKTVATITHEDARRKNIPTAEYEAVVEAESKVPIRVAYERRNRDLDPQLVWRGKDEQDEGDLFVQAPPLYIQEKVHPKALIDDLLRESRDRAHEAGAIMPDLFSEFNGIPKGVDRTEFYRHDQNWSNRMILGDSLHVMASLAEREGLRGKVQCIYLDPPYGIKFNSNFQWSTTSRDFKDVAETITREPEQVKAFRDTWRDGIHSYLSYLRDRLLVARELLTDSGSIFVQIGDENVHRVRSLLDEIFGDSNHVVDIIFKKKSSTSPTDAVNDYILWYGKNSGLLKQRSLYRPRKEPGAGSKMTALVQRGKRVFQRSDYSDDQIPKLISDGAEWARVDYPVVSQHPSETRSANFRFQGLERVCGRNKQWRFGLDHQMPRLAKAGRLFSGTGNAIGGIMYWSDWNHENFSNIWEDIHSENFPVYVVQTSTRAIERCLLMASDPGDLVLDPTCGSGTTAMVAEQWGRRWITIDTSRVALALSRARLMAGRYPCYQLADSSRGEKADLEFNGVFPNFATAVRGDVRRGFVYDRVPHVTLKSIADNSEIDVIWENWQATLEPIRGSLNDLLGEKWEEWEIPRDPDSLWPEDAKEAHASWWSVRSKRQAEIDRSIGARADTEILYDKPVEDKKSVRVAGPFTVESISPHRSIAVGIDDQLIDPLYSSDVDACAYQSFAQIIFENLKAAGVQQTHKGDKISFTSLVPWPGKFVNADGRYIESEGAGAERRAAIFVGPEFGTIMRSDLVVAAREAAEAGFDVLIACGFNYEAHTTEFNKLGRLTVLKARMNADLHMAEDLKKTDKANLFVVFGEPDIALIDEPGDKIRVKIIGVDVFHPNTGVVTSDGPDEIACWFIDTDYNEESFFVRHAYFLGANDPYTALKTTLKAEIDADAWASLNSDTSRAFSKPKSGRIAVKVINHLGDEVMKVFKIA